MRLVLRALGWIVALGVVVLVDVVAYGTSMLLAGFKDDYCATSYEVPMPPDPSPVVQDWDAFPGELKCEFGTGEGVVVRRVDPKTNHHLYGYAFAIALSTLYVVLALFRLSRLRRRPAG